MIDAITLEVGLVLHRDFATLAGVNRVDNAHQRRGAIKIELQVGGQGVSLVGVDRTDVPVAAMIVDTVRLVGPAEIL